MRCPRCQRESAEGSVFCPGCGAPLILRPEPSAASLDTTLDLDRRAASVLRPAQPDAAGPVSPAVPSPPASRPRSSALPAPPPVHPKPTPPAARPPPRPAAPPPRDREPVAPPKPAKGQTELPAPERAGGRSFPAPPLDSDRSHWDLRPSQLPRERRPDLGPEPVLPRERVAPPPPDLGEAAEPLPPPRPTPRPASRPPPKPDLEPFGSATVEVDIDPVELHLTRASDTRRVLAWILDGVPFVALFALALRLSLDQLPHATPLDFAGYLELAGAEAREITGPLFGGVVVLYFVYHALSQGLSGATLGKRLLGLRVVGPDGRRPGLGRATIRALLAAISLGLLGLGVLLALFTPSGRALHDLLARTWVVEAP